MWSLNIMTLSKINSLNICDVTSEILERFFLFSFENIKKGGRVDVKNFTMANANPGDKLLILHFLQEKQTPSSAHLG